MNNSDSASILASDVSIVPTDVTASQAHVIAVVSVACVLLVLVLLNLAALLLYTRAKRSLKYSQSLDAAQSYHYQLSSVDEDSHRHSYKPQSLQASASTQTTGVYKDTRRDGSKKSSKRRRSEGRATHIRSKSRRRRFEEEEENRVNAQGSAGTKPPLEDDDQSKSSCSTVTTANAFGTTSDLPGTTPTAHSQPKADSVITMHKAKSESALTSTLLQVPFDAVAPSTSDSTSMGWRVEQFPGRSPPLTSESLVEADKKTWIPITSARKTTLTSQTCSTSSPKTSHKRPVPDEGGATTRSHSEIVIHGQMASEKQESLSASLKKRYLETWQKAKNSIYGKHVTARNPRSGKYSEDKTAKETQNVAASPTAVKTNRTGRETNDSRLPQTAYARHLPTNQPHTAQATSTPTDAVRTSSTPTAPQPPPMKVTAMTSKHLDTQQEPKRKDSQISTVTTATDDCFDSDGEIRFVGVGETQGSQEVGGLSLEVDRAEVLLQDTGVWPMEALNHTLCFTAGLTSISSDDFDEIEL